MIRLAIILGLFSVTLAAAVLWILSYAEGIHLMYFSHDIIYMSMDGRAGIYVYGFHCAFDLWIVAVVPSLGAVAVAWGMRKRKKPAGFPVEGMKNPVD